MNLSCKLMHVLTSLMVLNAYNVDILSQIVQFLKMLNATIVQTENECLFFSFKTSPTDQL